MLCDPAASDGRDRVVAKLPAGDHQFSLSFLDFPPDEHFPDGFSRVTAALIKVTGVEVADWVQSSEALSVDGGTGVLFDVTNESLLPTAFASEDDLDLAVIGEVLARGFTVRPLHQIPAALAFFECGMGDGTYDLWTGVDPSGVVVALLADLEVLAHASVE